MLNSVVGILLFAVLQVFGQCLGLMGQSEEVVAEAAPYYNYLAWSIIPFMIFAAFKQFLEGVGNTMTGMVAVSYTHLDVYKRQILLCMEVCLSLQR